MQPVDPMMRATPAHDSMQLELWSLHTQPDRFLAYCAKGPVPPPGRAKIAAGTHPSESTAHQLPDGEQTHP